MKTLRVSFNKYYDDHSEVEYGPPYKGLLPDTRPYYGCKCLVKLPPYYCWCKKGFWDPDECIEHAIREHPNQ